MLPSHGLMVLIVDDDSQRANATAQLVRLLGSIPLIASSEPVAAQALPHIDVAIVRDGALGGRALQVLQAARTFPGVFRVLSTARDVPEQRLADWTVREPFTAIALGDMLARAHTRRQAAARNAPAMGAYA